MRCAVRRMASLGAQLPRLPAPEWSQRLKKFRRHAWPRRGISSTCSGREAPIIALAKFG